MNEGQTTTMSSMDIRPPCTQSTGREQGLLVTVGSGKDGVYSDMGLVQLDLHIRQTAATLYLKDDRIPGLIFLEDGRQSVD